MPPVPDTSGQVAFVIACLSGGLGVVASIAAWLIARQVKAIEDAAKSASEEARRAWNTANDAMRAHQWIWDDYKTFKSSVATREAVEGLKSSFDEVKRDVRHTGQKVEDLRIAVRLPARNFTPGSDPPKRG